MIPGAFVVRPLDPVYALHLSLLINRVGGLAQIFAGRSCRPFAGRGVPVGSVSEGGSTREGAMATPQSVHGISPAKPRQLKA